MKNRTKTLVEKLIANKILEKLWIYLYLIVDFIDKLQLVVGKDVILVVCDRLSKMAYFFVATIEETLAKELVRFFRNNI